jgi:hypothetical protein
MSFDIESARKRVGVPDGDTSKDAELVASLNAALAIAENYCDRKFLYREETARFYYDATRKYSLKRYPIDEVVEVIDSDGRFSEYKVHKLVGHVILKRPNYAEEVIITYKAGYQILPADLELALWGIFDAAYASISRAMSGNGMGTGASNVGAISSINIPDVGTVSFNTDAASSTMTNAVAAKTASWGQYGPFFLLLDAYKDHSC